jgi:5-formyltetrahydrofolate cyclo-ligase
MGRTLDTAKEALRKSIKARLARTPPEEFHAQGLAAAALIRDSPCWNRYATILLFLSFPREIDTRPLVDAALEAEKKVLSPRVEPGPDGRMCFYQEGRPLAPTDFPALIIVPGLAFDPQGGRLGRGKGYYDRFLANLDAAGREYCALGLCLPCQLAPEVPAEAWDHRMDALCTGKTILYVDNGRNTP